ncbi:MAG: nitroreductase family protein [candidate division WOR-3 bacterium]
MYGKVIDAKRHRVALALEKFIEVRRTIRSYLPDLLSREIVERIVQAALYAPTKNNQIKWSIYIVDHQTPLRPEFIRRLRSSYSYLSDIRALYESGYLDLDRYSSFVEKFMEGLAQIPIFVVMSANRPPASLPPALQMREMAHTLASCGFAAQNMLLAALAWGVGGGILTLVSDEAERELLELLGLSQDKNTIAMILTFGYPAEVPQRPHKHVDVKWL